MLIIIRYNLQFQRFKIRRRKEKEKKRKNIYKYYISGCQLYGEAL